MIASLRVLLVLLLLECAARPAAADESPPASTFVLAKLLLGRIDSDRYIPYGGCGDPRNGCISIGGFWKARMKVLRTYSGTLDGRYVTAWIPMAADPVEKTLFAVVEVRPDGTIVIRHWLPISLGFCLRDDFKTGEFGADMDAAANALAADRPCKPS